MITRNFNLFLNAGHSIPLVINVNQAEEGEQWVFSLFQEDGTPYIPTDGSIVGIKSDGYLINNSGTVVDGKVVIAETRQMTAAAGKAVFELRIDGLTHGTANFIVMVQEDPTDGGIVSDSDLSLIEEALSAVSPLPTGGTVGQVLTKTANGSAWSDAGTPTQEQVAEAVSDWADENITVETGVVIDNSLSVSGAAADAKKTGDEISALKSEISTLSSIPTEIKRVMDTLFQNVAFKNDDVYTDELATFHTWATAVNLISISAVFDQGTNLIFSTDSLDDLKQYLTVTANFSDSTQSEITAYTLSGTLTAGTITVTYEDKTTSFVVNVTNAELITLDLANPTSTTPNTGLSVTDGALRIYRTDTANTTYQAANYSLPMVDGYTYKVTAYATRTLGKIMFGFRNGNGQLYGGHTIGAQTENGEYSTEIPMIPTDNPSYDGAATILIAFFCNWSTKEKGDVTYSNIKVIKYQTPQGNS